jgi:hypothetical protein
MSTQFNETGEATQPASDFSEPRPLRRFEINRQGQVQNADLAEWKRDLEQRRAKPLPQRPVA